MLSLFLYKKENVMYHELEIQVIEALKRKKYLQRHEKFIFKASEEVAISSYNNDLYVCKEIMNYQKVIIYWGDIKRRNCYYEIFVAVISESERVLTVINQGILEYQEKI